MNIPIYTIGYGNRSVEAFIELLHRYEIAFLIDVRSQPYARFNPDYSKDALEQHLKQHSIRYMFMGDTLGGRPGDEDCYINGKVDYAVLREKTGYLQGIERLRTAWRKQLRVAIMCSELKPYECHRSKLIGNTLLEQHIAVAHIDESGELKGQEEINTVLTNGQLFLFDQSPVDLSKKIGVARKKRPSSGERQQ